MLSELCERTSAIVVGPTKRGEQRRDGYLDQLRRVILSSARLHQLQGRHPSSAVPGVEYIDGRAGSFSYVVYVCSSDSSSGMPGFLVTARLY